MASIVSVNISQAKGTIKTPVKTVSLIPTGVKGDAHAGPGLRQVSLLSRESIERFSQQYDRDFQAGEFAENITTVGLDLSQAKIRDRLTVGSAVLEVTQIGKTCHGDGCAIFREIGTCVMPREGIFARVITPGMVKAGDIIDHQPRPLRVTIITLSDRASRGDYPDRSGPAIAACLQETLAPRHWGLALDSVILPDEGDRLREVLLQTEADVIFTTGGTGIGPRDVTPDVVRALLDKEIPGLMEFIRVKYGADIPSALLSRAVAGVRGRTLIFTLPGSVKAVQEYMTEILKVLEHSLMMLWDVEVH